jgi:putative endonuclease
MHLSPKATRAQNGDLVNLNHKANRFYIGSTVNVSIRLIRHYAGHYSSTKAYRPWRLVYTETLDSLPKARQRERQIKNWKNPQYMLKTLNIIL